MCLREGSSVATKISSDVLQVMEQLKALQERPAGMQSDVVVIGGGYAGVELSAVVAEKLGANGRVKVSIPLHFTYIPCASPPNISHAGGCWESEVLAGGAALLGVPVIKVGHARRSCLCFSAVMYRP